MGTNRSTEYDLVVSHLGYEWEDVEDVIEVVIGKVPPGKAVRRYQSIFENGQKGRTGEGPQRGQLSQAAQIRSGARALLQVAIRSATSAKNLVQRTVEDHKLIRRNVFTAEEVDSILASRISDAIVPVIASPPSSAVETTSSVVFENMMFDRRTVQSLIVRSDSNKELVSIAIPNFVSGIDLNLFFTATAADWLSDQLGFQALASRRGRKNAHKALEVVQRS